MSSKRWLPEPGCDPAQWEPRAVARRCRQWLAATRRRRRLAWSLALVTAMMAVSGVAGAVAMAQTSAAAGGSSTIDGIAWTNVRDSSGVRLSDYMFITNTGSVTQPQYTAVWILQGFLFTVFLAMVTVVIWLIGFALEFRWMSMLDHTLTAVAESLGRQLSAPIVLATAAAIGAFFVGYFVVRGHHSKATMQVVTMVGVAVLGVPLLAHPMADVLSPNGLMAQGRDLGIAVAAGLNGDSNPNPRDVVSSLQATLADNFVRRPVQVWNFGHVVDDVSPRCRAAWSAGVTSRSQDTAKRALANCGDREAYSKVENPDITQVGTGLLLLVFGLVLLEFGLYLAIKIMGAALDAFYHTLMSIFGFAAGGFVYGPTQTFLVRNVVGVFVDAGRMVAYTVFLAVYVLVLGRLFAQARGQEMAVIIVAAIIEIVAIYQVRRLSASLDRGNKWIAQRFATAIAAGAPATAGGAVLGMGGGSDSSPLVLQNLYQTARPVLSYASKKQRAGRRSLGEQLEGSRHARLENIRNMQEGARLQRALRQKQRKAAETAAKAAGGIHTPLGVAAAIQGAMDAQATRGDAGSIAQDLGANSNAVHRAILAGQAIEDGRRTSLPARYGRLAMAAARVEKGAKSGTVDEADFAALELYARRFSENLTPISINDFGQLRGGGIDTQAKHMKKLAEDPLHILQKEELIADKSNSLDPMSWQYARQMAYNEAQQAIESYKKMYKTDPKSGLEHMMKQIDTLTKYSLAE
ncbi:hypothetical protein IFM12275_24380 [Nocardia sputorum]|uniref:hypothetical protein n=1 Tax=Nocardia sputorum TaxID=2984338 RepID=UPI002491F702|nr:hypothetical protein [Nocardia sputorum]BDT92462.1 hypothetical protein IFM12275_24380 [Nocardia sputorum]